jgi:hypothetical protein
MGILSLEALWRPCTGWLTGVPVKLISIYIITVRKCETLGLRKTLDPKLFPLLPKDSILPIWAELQKALSILQDLFYIIPACSDHCEDWIRI